MITPAELANWFTYHPPVSDDQKIQYVRIRRAGLAFAEAILRDTPAGADQSAAIRKIREAVMTANAAIACDATEELDIALPWKLTCEHCGHRFVPDFANAATHTRDEQRQLNEYQLACPSCTRLCYCVQAGG